MNTRHARRVPVAVHQQLAGAGGYDYADAFEIRLSETDPRSAEEFARCALEQAPRPVRWTVSNVQRHVLRLRLGPPSDPGYLFGWRIVASEPDMVRLEAESPLMGRAILVGTRPDRDRAVITTYIFFARPMVATVVWKIVGPLHRGVARYLLKLAAERPYPAGHRIGAA